MLHAELGFELVFTMIKIIKKLASNKNQVFNHHTSIAKNY